MAIATHAVAIEIGGMTVVVRTGSSEFARLLRDRYGPFVLDARQPAEATGAGRTTGEPEALHRVAKGEALRHTIPCKGRPRDDSGASSSRGFPAGSFQLEVELMPQGIMSDADEARVRSEGRRWVMERGDFRAEWDPVRRRGRVRQSCNPYAIDAVLRILHSLILAREGGFLVHAASAIRNGRAFLFAGVSGAGKTTISRLAPPDVLLLSDEISYVRSQDPGFRSQTSKAGKQKAGGGRRGKAGQNAALDSTTSLTRDHRQPPCTFVAYGTPFAGELARIGENLRAPVAALYFLAQGTENRIEAVSQAEAARALLRNILFFAHDKALVQRVFQSAFEFVGRVPVGRLVFAPDARVWDLIQ